MMNYAPPGKLAFLTSLMLALVFTISYGASSILIYGEFFFQTFPAFGVAADRCFVFAFSLCAHQVYL